MKILGRWGPFEAPYVSALFSSKKLNIFSSAINFLLDTGASRTCILDKDAERLGIEYTKLTQLKEGVTGIGGIAEAFLINDAQLIFATKEGYFEERIQIVVLRHKVEDKEILERIRRLPSLLGRDFLNKYKVILNKAKNLVVVTDEE